MGFSIHTQFFYCSVFISKYLAWFFMSSYEVVLANLNTLGISSNKMPPPPKLKKVIGIMIIKGSVLIGYVVI